MQPRSINHLSVSATRHSQRAGLARAGGRAWSSPNERALHLVGVVLDEKRLLDRRLRSRRVLALGGLRVGLG
jgi:hypothetical protein